MSDAKKPGARDISDLKARLGLKKGDTGSRTAAGGVVPPPGAGKAGYVPPPPGVAPPPGAAGPIIPDASVDPFGAMNAMAAQQAVRAQPEIIVVDHKNVEKVHDRAWGKRILILSLKVLALVAGFMLGGINYERKEVGRTIGDAKILHKEFSDVGKKLQNLQNVLYTAKEGGAEGRPAYKLLDKSLTENLATIDLGVPEGDESKFLIYHAHLYTMDPKLIADTLMFYTQIRSLEEKLKDHVRRSTEDLNKATVDAMKAFGGETNLAAIIRTPPAKEQAQGAKPFIEIVQLGQPVCADNLPHAEGCGGPPPGFQFRSDIGQPWGSKKAAADQIAVDSIIYLGDNGILRTLMKGSAKTIEEAEYYQRITEIDTMTENLIKLRKDIENRMNTLAQRSKPVAI